MVVYDWVRGHFCCGAIITLLRSIIWFTGTIS